MLRHETDCNTSWLGITCWIYIIKILKNNRVESKGEYSQEAKKNDFKKQHYKSINLASSTINRHIQSATDKIGGQL